MLFTVGCESILMSTYFYLFLMYNATISISTYSGIFWHLNHEQSGCFMVTNYVFAGAWFALDGALAVILAPSITIIIVYLLNTLATALYLAGMIYTKRRRTSYRLIKTMWNLLYAAKAIYIAHLINCVTVREPK